MPCPPGGAIMAGGSAMLVSICDCTSGPEEATRAYIIRVPGIPGVGPFRSGGRAEWRASARPPGGRPEDRRGGGGVAIETCRPGEGKATTDADCRCQLTLPEEHRTLRGLVQEGRLCPRDGRSGAAEGDGTRPRPTRRPSRSSRGRPSAGSSTTRRGSRSGGERLRASSPTTVPRESGEARPSLWDYEVKTDDQGRWRATWSRPSWTTSGSASPTPIRQRRHVRLTPKPTMERLRDRTGVDGPEEGAHGHRPRDRGRRRARRGAPRSRRGPTGSARTTRDEDRRPGRFRFAGARRGRDDPDRQGEGALPRPQAGRRRQGHAAGRVPPRAGRTVTGRVVDGQGKPVAGAFVAADTWRGYRSLMWRVDTDKDGRFRWDEAPADEVLCDLGKLGFMSIRPRRLEALRREVVVTMLRPLKVRGSVVDADTGKPVEAFTVLPGIDWENNPNTYWQRQPVVRGTPAGTRSSSTSPGPAIASGSRPTATCRPSRGRSRTPRARSFTTSA